MDAKGRHQEELSQTGWEIETLRGPVGADKLLPIVHNYDGIICGDDEYNKEVLTAGKSGKLKILSKYGIGLDRIDLEAAADLGIEVRRCHGVNQVAVAEHVIGLILSFYKNIHLEYAITTNGGWQRMIGEEVAGKKIGIIGLGQIGKEVAIRAAAMGMEVSAFDSYPDMDFIETHKINQASNVDDLLGAVDIVSLNTPLTEQTRHLINTPRVQSVIKEGTLIVNTARGGLVDESAIIEGIQSKRLAGYVTDVLDVEPMDPSHPFKEYDNILITPHIGSRTKQSIQRQGAMAVNNLRQYLESLEPQNE